MAPSTNLSGQVYANEHIPSGSSSAVLLLQSSNADLESGLTSQLLPIVLNAHLCQCKWLYIWLCY